MGGGDDDDDAVSCSVNEVNFDLERHKPRASREPPRQKEYQLMMEEATQRRRGPSNEDRERDWRGSTGTPPSSPTRPSRADLPNLDRRCVDV